MTLHVVSPEAHVDITTSKVSLLQGAIDEGSARTYEYQSVQTLDQPGDRLVLINSPGGTDQAGEQIMALMDIERQAGTRMICVVRKLAASMAFNILSHCDVRLSEARAHLLFHSLAFESLQSRGGPEGRLTPEVLVKLAGELKKADAHYKRANLKLLNMTSDEYDQYSREDHFWTAEQLVARKYLHGLAVIVPIKNS